MVLQPIDSKNFHRWEHFSTITGSIEGELLGRNRLTSLINHPNGMFQGVTIATKMIWAINKSDLLEDYQATLRLANEILNDCPALSQVWLTSMINNNSEPKLEQVVRTE
ncbi:hypothetical protein L0B53_15130 [Vibrio sp. SS-MA-C1-2]|uniref:hypothetical protein n=1 Tax=Vibrio sp. SS-MA-C1-2 TaxID=2908646 RepID=UPI001F1BB805|nr:hypothetical protein [Vibrio sp. SS-MA-C1-2]UJF18341.1 hypothetical protein L0B53_15130 [Vibrio sp. SS-MA-C1-2]